MTPLRKFVPFDVRHGQAPADDYYTPPDPLTPEQKARADAEWDAEPSPPMRIAEHQAEARRGMSAERWAALNEEFER